MSPVTVVNLTFFIYCFFGWVYESTVVSILERRLVNRGFIHGPFLPIYGVGALLCIGSGMLAGGNPILTFVYAVLVCTIVELGTGVTMERLFKVRYWDYTNVPGNIRGYICPPVSLLWGVIALAVTFFVQARVYSFVLLIPPFYAEALSYAISIAFAVDFALSWAEAIDLRNILEEFAENNRKIQELRQRVDEVQDALAANVDGAREKVGNLRSDYSENIRAARGYLLEVATDARDVVRDTARDKTGANDRDSSHGAARATGGGPLALGARLDAYRGWQSEKLELAKGKLAEISGASEKLNAWVVAMRKDIETVERGLHPHLPSQDHHVSNMLRRNPRAISISYAKELGQLKRLIAKSAGDGAEGETRTPGRDVDADENRSGGK